MNIPPAEAQIMDALWRAAPMSTEEIVAAVGPTQDWAEGTVRTLINRLLRKKAIVGERDGPRYHYRPLIKRDDYVLTESQGLLDRLFEGGLTPMVAHFARHQALSPEDIAALKKLIEELEP